MLIRLSEVLKSINANQAALTQIKNSQINVESHSDLTPRATASLCAGVSPLRNDAIPHPIIVHDNVFILVLHLQVKRMNVKFMET